ncbi:MAG: phosphatase PAP2 family protein [Candidatus Nanopelagicales bacterium]
MNPPPRPPVLAGLAAGLWAAAIALAAAVVNASAEPTIDTGISEPIHAWASDNAWAVSLARFFAVMGSGAVLFPITVAVVVGLAVRKHPWWAGWVALAGLGGLLISETVKDLGDRQRPIWPDPFETLTSASFPSGHAMAGIYGWAAFGVVALSLLSRPWNLIAAMALMAFGVLMGPSRLVLGVHWPTDVLEGWLLASAWVLTVSAALLWWRQRIAPGE